MVRISGGRCVPTRWNLSRESHFTHVVQHLIRRVFPDCRPSAPHFLPDHVTCSLPTSGPWTPHSTRWSRPSVGAPDWPNCRQSRAPPHPHSHLSTLHLARIFASCGFPPSQPCGIWQSAGSWQRRVRHSPQTQIGDPRAASQPRLARTFAIEVTTAQLTSICRSPAYEKRALGALRGRSREDHAVTTTRTSGSNPINVAFLAAADHGLPGAIGVTLAPGKVDLRRGWDRDLEADLTRLRSVFGIDVIVSLMQPSE